jgi:arylesterase / paraoxonase
MSGVIWMYEYNSGSSDQENISELKILDYPEHDRDFHPLGIEYHEPSSTLFVVNHNHEGSRIDIFKVDFEQKAAIFTQSVVHHLVWAPNAIAVINEHELYVTNDKHFVMRRSTLLSKLETYTAYPGGSVTYINLNTGEIRVVARVPFANGLAFVNATTLAVASSNRPAVYFYNMNLTDHSLELVRFERMPFHPDNLSVDKNGTLLITGHAHLPSLNKYAFNRAFCRSKESVGSDVCSAAISPSWVAEWTEGKGRQDLFVGSSFSTSSMAVRDTKRRIGIVTGLYEDGLLVFKS